MSVLEYVTVTGRLSSIVVDYVDADSHPDERVASAFVDFIPRLPSGTILWCPTLTPPRGIAVAPVRARFDASDGVLRTIAHASVNETQRVTIAPGTTTPFVLSYNGTPSAQIAYDAPVFAVEAALQAIPAIGAGNVTVTGTPGQQYNVIFTGSLGGQDIASLTTASAGVTISVYRQGALNAGVELLACNEALPIDELIYDLVFSSVRYDKRDQYIAPFAIRAPRETATIDLADANLERLPGLQGLKPIAPA